MGKRKLNNTLAPKYRLKSLMQIKKVTVADVASHCGVTSGAVHKWMEIEEDSTSSMSSDSMRLIADLLKVDMEDIYTKQLEEVA